MKTGKTYDMGYRVKRKDGEEIVVHSQGEVILNEKGESIGMIGVIHDITERRKAEEALRKSEEKYKLLYENAVVAMFRTAIKDGKAL